MDQKFNTGEWRVMPMWKIMLTLHMHSDRLNHSFCHSAKISWNSCEELTQCSAAVQKSSWALGKSIRHWISIEKWTAEKEQRQGRKQFHNVSFVLNNMKEDTKGKKTQIKQTLLLWIMVIYGKHHQWAYKDWTSPFNLLCINQTGIFVELQKTNETSASTETTAAERLRIMPFYKQWGLVLVYQKHLEG